MSSDSKFFIGVAAIAVVVLAVIIFSSGKGNKSSFDEIINKASEIGQKLGPDNAPVKIVEFSDFQCPACADASPVIKEVQTKNSDKVQLIFVHMPLSSIHDNAIKAAQASEAAAKQGKFWEIADLLFAKQDEWEKLSDPQNYFLSLAKALELDVDRFTQDYSSVEIEKAINDSYNWAVSLGINATPTFYLNGQKIEGGKSAQDWQDLIDKELKK